MHIKYTREKCSANVNWSGGMSSEVEKKGKQNNRGDSGRKGRKDTMDLAM